MRFLVSGKKCVKTEKICVPQVFLEPIQNRLAERLIVGKTLYGK
jgi:hypothetical protein